MNKGRAKDIQKQLGSTKKQAESIVIAQDRMLQVGDCAKHRMKKEDAKKEAEKEAEAYNSQDWLESKGIDADRALLEAVQAGKPEAIRTFYLLTKRLKQQNESGVKIELTADEVTRRNLRAEKELREGGFGVEKVPDESALLPKDIRENQEPEGANSV